MWRCSGFWCWLTRIPCGHCGCHCRRLRLRLRLHLHVCFVSPDRHPLGSYGPFVLLFPYKPCATGVASRLPRAGVSRDCGAGSAMLTDLVSVADMRIFVALAGKGVWVQEEEVEA